jgi:hypothetical protein
MHDAVAGTTRKIGDYIHESYRRPARAQAYSAASVHVPRVPGHRVDHTDSTLMLADEYLVGELARKHRGRYAQRR